MIRPLVAVMAALGLVCCGSDKASPPATAATTTSSTTTSSTVAARTLSHDALVAVNRCNDALQPIRRETLAQDDLDAAEVACRPAAAEVKADLGTDDEVTFLVLAIVASNSSIHLPLAAALTRWDAWYETVA